MADRNNDTTPDANGNDDTAGVDDLPPAGSRSIWSLQSAAMTKLPKRRSWRMAWSIASVVLLVGLVLAAAIAFGWWASTSRVNSTHIVSVPASVILPPDSASPAERASVVPPPNSAPPPTVAPPADANDNTVFAPAPGVVCDHNFCADEKGISFGLTESYLDKDAAAKLLSQGDFNLTEFSFANGIFCDVKERLCREDRYFGADGKHSGAVSEKYTAMLFG